VNDNIIKAKRGASGFEEAFFHSNDTYIHPSAIVGDNVELGNNVKVGPFCVIAGNVKIGDNTRLHANVMVGFPAQNIGTKESYGNIEIGQNCELREFVTIHASKYPDGLTKIGNSCYIMNYSHVSHDSILEDNVTLINNVSLGGHSYIEKNAFLMAYAATHQFCRVGTFTAVAPFSGARQDLPPFCLFNEQPAAYAGLNIIALKRAGFSSETINALKHVTKLFYNEKMFITKIKEIVANEPWGNNPQVQHFLNFIENSKRGVSMRAVSDQNNKVQQQEGL
jgi:UDP-N-acetylglucosamine acyltransferase